MEIIKVLDYFFLYSFAGWILESIYKSIYAKKFVNSGFLFGPFCPIYGLGALIMYVSLSGYNNNPLHVFLIGFVILSVWEYIVAWALEKMFKTKYWDYSNKKYNINGRVCLENSFFWGMLGLIFIYILHPFVQARISDVNNIVLISTTAVLSVGMIVDLSISIAKVNGVKKKLEDIKKIRDEIKDKLEELRNVNITKESTKEAIQLLINDLKTQEVVIKEKVIKQTSRIRDAFPSMKSEAVKQIKKYIRK